MQTLRRTAILVGFAFALAGLFLPAVSASVPQPPKVTISSVSHQFVGTFDHHFKVYKSSKLQKQTFTNSRLAGMAPGDTSYVTMYYGITYTLYNFYGMACYYLGQSESWTFGLPSMQLLYISGPFPNGYPSGAGCLYSSTLNSNFGSQNSPVSAIMYSNWNLNLCLILGNVCATVGTDSITTSVSGYSASSSFT